MSVTDAQRSGLAPSSAIPPVPVVSVFADVEKQVYRHQYDGQIFVHEIHGGTPSDPAVIHGFLQSKLMSKEAILRSDVLRTMNERYNLNFDPLDESLIDDKKLSEKDFNEKVMKEAALVNSVMTDPAKLEEVIADLAAAKHLNGFKRDSNGLYIEGRQLKAAIKESANIRWAKERWGPTAKGTKGYWSEHVFVTESRIYLTRQTEDGSYVPVETADGVAQRFVQTRFGTAIQNEEFVGGAFLDFHILCDEEFDRNKWGELWVTSEKNGLGAARSQGYGTYLVTRWDHVDRTKENGKKK